MHNYIIKICITIRYIYFYSTIHYTSRLMVYRLTEFHVSGFTGLLTVTIGPEVQEYFCFAPVLLCHVLEINYCNRIWKTFRESNTIHRFRTPLPSGPSTSPF